MRLYNWIIQKYRAWWKSLDKIQQIMISVATYLGGLWTAMAIINFLFHLYLYGGFHLG